MFVIIVVACLVGCCCNCLDSSRWWSEFANCMLNVASNVILPLVVVATVVESSMHVHTHTHTPIHMQAQCCRAKMWNVKCSLQLIAKRATCLPEKYRLVSRLAFSPTTKATTQIITTQPYISYTSIHSHKTSNIICSDVSELFVACLLPSCCMKQHASVLTMSTAKMAKVLIRI